MSIENISYLIGYLGAILLLPTVGFLIIWGAKSKLRKVIGYMIYIIGLLTSLSKVIVWSFTNIDELFTYFLGGIILPLIGLFIITKTKGDIKKNTGWFFIIFGLIFLLLIALRFAVN